MNNFDEIEQHGKVHSLLRQAMPRAWNPFFAGFGSLRPVQLAAIIPILNGNNTLVTAPTAGGKTEAVIAPICERVLQHRWHGLSVLLITPTRALVNDLYNRLHRPCGLMKIRLGRKTADHWPGEESKDQLLITTPESTESLLTFRREWLGNIQAIVLDEIHLLDGSARGDQLRSLLSRLAAYRHNIDGNKFRGLQTIALSATVDNPNRLASAYLGQPFDIVSVPGQRDLESHIVLASGTDQERAEASIHALQEYFPDAHKVLVFVNSRKQVDTGAGYFRCGRFENVPVYGHHGSMSKEKREDVESRFKDNAAAICVATMTLEVGIDIGDIDLVICMDPPFSMSSFLQRIGRGCRRLRGRTRVLCMARDRASELMFEALVRQAAVGVPSCPTPPYRRSVLVQQILAYLQQVPKQRRVIEQLLRVFVSHCEPVISEETVRAVANDMVETGLIDRQGQVYQPASHGRDFIESKKIYGNIQPNPLEVALVDVDSGKIVATVAGLGNSVRHIRVAGRPYEVLPGGSAFRQKVRGGGDQGGSPRYHTRFLPYASDIGTVLASRFEINESTLVMVPVGDSVTVMTWLGRLMNSILKEGLRKVGHAAVDHSFHLTIQGSIDAADLLIVFRNAINHLSDNNPLGQMTPERMIDIGPHFQHLSASQQVQAREDWLDTQYLRTWINSITTVQSIGADSELGRDFLTLP